MALMASELATSSFLRVLLLGPPKVGKSTMCIGTSPGPVRVLLAEDDSALVPAIRAFGPESFTFARVPGYNEMTREVLAAKNDAKKGEVKTCIVDSLSIFAKKLEKQCLDATDNGHGPDGRRAYPDFNRRVDQIIDQLFSIKAHLIVISHYIDTGGGEVAPDDGGEPTPKTGEGVVPMLPGKARILVPARFPDVVWMDYSKGKRVLITGPLGAWGPGCRSMNGTKKIPADYTDTEHKRVGIKALIRAFEKANVQKETSRGP